MKVFVTGGTGFIGNVTVKHLMESGHECICLARNSSNTDALKELGVHLVAGDVTDRKSLDDGMKGSDAVINLANVFSLWEPDIRLYKRINVDGTRNVMEAALHAKMRKVIHVSSIVTWGKTPDAPFNEKSPVGEHTSEYARTKYEGDLVAWDLHRNEGLPLVMVYPCAVLGPNDPKPMGNYIQMLINKKMPIRGLESAVFSFVHVNNVAEAIVRALEKEGDIGEGYIVGNERCSMRQINSWVHEISGVPLPFLSIPTFMVKINAFFLTALANLTKRPPLWGLSSDSVSNILTEFKADGAKAERELGISYIPVRTAIKECIESFS